VAVPLLTFTTNKGNLIPSEYQDTLDPQFTNPLPGRPALSTQEFPYFEVSEWSFGTGNTINFSASGSDAGKVRFEPLTVSRRTDLLTPSLFLNECAGVTFKYVDLFLSKDTSGNSFEVPYLVYGMGTVAVTSLDSSGNIDLGEEKVQFQYQQLWFGYRKQLPDGNYAKWNIKGWDRVRNRPTPP
jgi:type VI protein secretion system component Hcp